MIFIGGIHGVGKTSFCSRLSEEIQLSHYSSSKLIASEKKVQFSTDKKVIEAHKNQDFLLQALEKLNITKKNYLLDGHFCLLNSNGNILKIPEETFVKLAPTYIVVLYDEIASISKRLYKRDKQNYDPELLEKFQEEELNYSSKIANRLGTPYHVFDLSTNQDIQTLISKILVK